jgi:hypothetical protein
MRSDIVHPGRCAARYSRPFPWTIACSLIGFETYSADPYLELSTRQLPSTSLKMEVVP